MQAMTIFLLRNVPKWRAISTMSRAWFILSDILVRKRVGGKKRWLEGTITPVALLEAVPG
jgi:hypothetical protein